jgi:predicted lipid-binding transport protein (Tim44 family)
MAISTIIGIAFFAVAAVLLFVALGVVVCRRSHTHHRVPACNSPDKAAEQSHTVGQREALAEETAAQARVAQAEGDAKTAHAAGLTHQAQALRSDAATARDDVKKDFERADTIDPDSQTHDTTGEDTGTRETPPGSPGDTHAPRPMRRAG